ncbi:MAG: hypothetical protein JNL55_29610 [Steroidobacter sp.]|nr:hypothetical protein [Steroidobacter sp.]
MKLPADDPFAGLAHGPYRTGTEEQLWIDEQRLETTTQVADDRRPLLVQIWYPAKVSKEAQRAPYILNPQLYSTELQKGFARYKDVRAASVRAAPLASEPGRLPILLYNPGGGAQVFTGVVQAEFLASHGYLVVGIGHTGLNGIERFPDGSTYLPDVEIQPRFSEEEKQALSEEERFQRTVKHYAERMMPTHVEDIRFVLNRLARANATPGDRFHNRLDLERVGALGWSLGGALALQATRDEPRVKAAVNLDGWLFTDVADSGTQRPIMQLRTGPVVEADEGADVREVEASAESRFWKLYARSGADWFDVMLPRARHGHFSASSLLLPHDPRRLHPTLAHDIVNGYVLEFFDTYLRGREPGVLLSGQRSFPEAGLIRNKK